MTPDNYCRQKTAASGSSFTLGFLFLPAAKKRAMRALYAFCREVDDIVDDCHDPDIAALKLAWWREEVTRIFTGQPEHPVGRALTESVREFRLPQEHFLDIIEGMEMDLRHTRYPDFEQLSLYCYRVASVVGILSTHIFGFRAEVAGVAEATLDYARDLGMALQLTNIIRDVGEDARRGRVYLPQEDLRQFQVSEADILQSRKTSAFTALMRFQSGRAEEFYTRAFATLSGLPASERRAQRPGLVMGTIYHALLREIVASDFPVLTSRVRLGPVFKFWLAARAWMGLVP